jgi:hypothetical protein
MGLPWWLGGGEVKKTKYIGPVAARDGILGNQFNKRLLLLHAIRSPFYWRILKKTILFSGFKILTKKSATQENSSLFMNSIL